MARDLNYAWGWLERLTRRVDRLFSGAMLENASITNGRLRLIGGLLRVDSGGRVQIVGTLEIDGATTVTGVFDVEGPWDLAGDGTITGNVSIAGNVTATGVWTQIGEWHLNGNGSITGDVDITGILTLLSELVVSSLGKITVGDMVIDPTNGGSVTFPGGAVVRGHSGNGVTLNAGAYSAVVREGYAALGTAASSFEIDGFSGLSIRGVVSESGLGTPPNTLHVLPDGRLRKSTGL